MTEHEKAWRTEYGTTFVNKLSEKIDTFGVKYEELANIIGVSKTTMYRYMRGDRIPNGYVFYKIAEVLRYPNQYSEVRCMTESEWRSHFANTLRVKLRRNKITQKKLSNLTNISEVSIVNYINKKRSPTLDVIFRIADILGCNIYELIAFDNGKEN